MKLTTLMLGTAIAALGSGAAIAGHTVANRPDGETAVKRSHDLGEVKFRFDSAAVGADASRAIDDAAAFAAANPTQRIVLDAHCDPVGTSAYNVGLAIRRAESVRDRLKASGVPEDRIVFAIYGENGAHRARQADDRRVTLWPTHAPLTAVIDHTFAGHGTAVTWDRPLSTAQIAAAPEPVASR